MKLGLIVEGHGEVEALPILVRRIAADHGLHALDMSVPFRLPRGQMTKESELKRAVELVARKTGESAPILILLDADDSAACIVAPKLLAIAQVARPDRRIAVVAAVREYEAWFLAAAPSLSGQRGLPERLEMVGRPESVTDPKGWLGSRMPPGYTETLDQSALSARMDLRLARSASSFDKLVRDLGRLLQFDAQATRDDG